MTNPSKSGQYFEEKKKGEMNQLKNALNNMINQNDTKKGREVIRKVIGYMTLGMDASPVFSEMCRASFTNDEVMKKMIYFYLTTYAEDNPDLAIMAVNTFKKDCKHTSSKIRGMALRNLCSFKSSDYVNTVLPVIQELLSDYEPYVKKTAIMGLLKVFYVEPGTILNDKGIIDTLSNMIKDSDPLVSINALQALDEILISEGGLNINSKIYFYLMNRLKEYNEWQQTCIIEILYRYTPNNEKEHYEIMTILWEKLKHSSTPLVLGSIRIILKLAKEKEDLFRNVVEKIKAPLLTLMTGNENTGTFETTYIVLQHIEYVIEFMGGKAHYEKDFKYFYCKVDEPTYIKNLKVKILGLLANEYNLGDLLNELNDYALDVDIEMSRKSVRVLTDIALRLPEVSKALLVNIISFYKSEKQHLTNESIISFHQILRKYPKLFPDVSSPLLEFKQLINETESTKSFIWILGTFSHQIDDSPYLLEEYIENQDLFYSYDNSIKQILLTSILQTFLKRPVETQSILPRIFKLVFQSDKSSVTLLDHAAFYYRALKDNVEEVKKGFASMESEMSRYKEINADVSFEEDFNSLSMIYKQKEAKFIKNYQYFISMRNKELGLIEPKVQEADEIENENEQMTHQPQIDQGFSLDQPIEYESLEADVTLTSDDFEKKWSEHEQFAEETMAIQNEDDLDEEGVQELCKMWRIYAMASAEEENGKILKFYLYAKPAQDDFSCIELQFNKMDKSCTILTKSREEVVAKLINLYVKEFLSVNQLVY